MINHHINFMKFIKNILISPADTISQLIHIQMRFTLMRPWKTVCPHFLIQKTYQHLFIIWFKIISVVVHFLHNSHQLILVTLKQFYRSIRWNRPTRSSLKLFFAVVIFFSSFYLFCLLWLNKKKIPHMMIRSQAWNDWI